MKLAIVHDWIGPNIGGAERVLKELTRIWPDAPVYTLFADQQTIRQHFPATDIRTSGLNRLPAIHRLYPYAAPLMPAAIEGIDLSGFDTVLSSSVLFAKGIIVRPGTRHVCYCYSPSRMLWDRAADYERRGKASALVRHVLRSWDHAAAKRPDEMVAISQTVADRIRKYYRRDALVIPPPVQIPPATEVVTGPERYFLMVARMVPHKNIEMVVEAFHKLRYRLDIVGDGPLRDCLRTSAGRNTHFHGMVSDKRLNELYAGCEALIMANEEDFGLTAVEAMAHGKPVLALRGGGALETIIEGVTGEFYNDAIPEALADGIRRIRNQVQRYDPGTIRAHAQAYAADIFEYRMRTLLC